MGYQIWNNIGMRFVAVLCFYTFISGSLISHYITVPLQDERLAQEVEEQKRKAEAVGLVSTDLAQAVDDTLNSDCGYERRAVEHRLRIVKDAQMRRDSIRAIGYMSAISSGSTVGMLTVGIGGAGVGAIAGSFVPGVGTLSGAIIGAVGCAIGSGINCAIIGAFNHRDALREAEEAVETAEEYLDEALEELAACLRFRVDLPKL